MFQLMQGFEQLGVAKMEQRSWILIVYCFLFPLLQIRKPNILAVCSLLANILTLVGTITVFVYIFSVKTFDAHLRNWRAKNEVQWTKLPLTIGVTYYAYQLVAPLVSESMHFAGFGTAAYSNLARALFLRKPTTSVSMHIFRPLLMLRLSE